MKSKSTLFGLLLASLVVVAVLVSDSEASPTWKRIQTDLGEISPALSFWNETSGYVLNFISGPGPEMLRTNDGGKTLTSLIPNMMLTGLQDIVTWNDGEEAVSAGLSLLRQSIAITTADGGQTWSKSQNTVLTANFRSIQRLSNGAIALFGTWSVLQGLKGVESYGIALSNDNAASFTYIDWPFPAVSPVGGTFIGSQLVFVAGSAETELPDGVWYQSYVASSNDGGASWTTLFAANGTHHTETPHAISLGSIQFVSATTGYVTGRNRTRDGNFAFLMATENAGQTWTNLLELPGGVFTKVICVAPDHCFVIGSAPCECEEGNAVVYETTNGGKSFQKTLIPGVMAFADLSYVNSEVMYATALTNRKTSDLFAYSARP
jgi:hypothetical protein